jgi:hypothetical protein
VLLAGAAIAAMPTHASALNLSGSWNISGSIQQGGQMIFSFTPRCVFQQAGATLTGTCKGPNSLGPATGRVNGRNVLIQANVVPYTSIGYRGSIQLSGTLAPDNVIRGQMRVSSLPGRIGVFTAQRP